ncbi:hypothetical protein MRB53_024977 [Persea americana]|uniref:Uncharacterized protein n=1 Tax=Persea americana TaxID=3435 RepID=A0ACC2LDY7_PERAE|nr:hypothetical protein MRB53_024977 [Persea americana]
MAGKLKNLQKLLLLAVVLMLFCFSCSGRLLEEQHAGGFMANGRWSYRKLPKGQVPPSGPSTPLPPPPPPPIAM